MFRWVNLLVRTYEDKLVYSYHNNSMANPPSATATQITNHLTTSLSVTPRPNWIQTFLSTQKPTTPLPSLLATAKVRLLNAEITSVFINSSLSSSSSSSAAATTTTVPVNIHDASQPEHRIRGPIALQVLGVEDLSRSRWSQLEDIEAAERGETTKGREIVRVLPTFGQQDAAYETPAAAAAPAFAAPPPRAGTCGQSS